MNSAKKNTALQALKYSFVFVLIFWVIELVQYIGFDLATYGILPRSKEGLIGILAAPFLHGDWQHLIGNTIPFFVLSFLLFAFYKRQAWGYFILLWLLTGLLTWCIGRSSWHIGASGVVYALASFLVFGGIASRNWLLILVSIVVVVAYSGLFWGIFPQDARISWEGHLSGALSGLILAILFRKKLQKKSSF